MARIQDHAGRSATLAALAAGALFVAGCGVGSSGGAVRPGSGTPERSVTASATSVAGHPAQPATAQLSTATSSTIPPGLLGKDVEAIPTSSKVVALTFDGGSNADGLTSILSTLAAQQVPATFFLTGSWASSYPAAVKKLVTAGYRLGNHTATHPHLTKLSDAAITRELTRGRAQIIAAGGTEPQPLFRFPYGDRNAHAISVVNKAGYVPVRWSVDTLGWKGTSGGMTKQKVINRAVGAAKPGEIVLMHLGSNPDDHTTLDAAALGTVISKLKARGYGFASLDALLGGGVILPGCDPTFWRTAPVTVAHDPQVPPVPVVTGIRTGSHPECRFDRVVFDLNDAQPGYQLRYVTSVSADPSGQPVTVPGGGTKFLLIVMHPAQGHTDAGATTIAPASAALGYPMLKGYAVTGDFEGYLSVVLGLAKDAQIRTGEVAGRWYVDVAY